MSKPEFANSRNPYAGTYSGMAQSSTGLAQSSDTAPIEQFSDPPTWPDPLNYDKRIRNLSNRVADLELAVAKLTAKNTDDARSMWRAFRWGGWK